ncbi:MAG: metal ABC transporter permease [Planctomycetota bacterium]|nr:metal ABC transporter permease [Planctomycetota bacterium]
MIDTLHPTSVSRRIVHATAVLAALCAAASPAIAGPHEHEHVQRDSTPSSPSQEHPNSHSPAPLIVWPTWDEVTRVLSLRDYNTRVVLLGTMVLGMTAGLIGTFMLLRKRALVGDVVSHASLPGIAIAYIVMESHSAGSGKSLTGLSIGAMLAGVSGVLCTTAIRRFTRIKEDAAMAIVLSIFFGLGIALFTIVQRMPTGSAAGLSAFIYGKASTMKAADVQVIAVVSVVAIGVCMALFRQFSLLCFDEDFAKSQGWPTGLLDLALMGLVVCVSVIGQKSVGLLLVVAMLIIPAASARFWTNDVLKMAVAATLIGGLTAFFGVTTSALFPKFAAGATIVLVGSSFFTFSLFFGLRRGFVRRAFMHHSLKQRVGQDDLLRSFYELLETDAKAAMKSASPTVNVSDTNLDINLGMPRERLLAARSWSTRRLTQLIKKARRSGLVQLAPDDSIQLTMNGAVEARRAVRNHRLWELFLIEYADIAPSHVDRDADEIEHVLEPAIVAELVELMNEQFPEMRMPPSPHPLELELELELEL